MKRGAEHVAASTYADGPNLIVPALKLRIDHNS
jgi:hypothetical protein